MFSLPVQHIPSQESVEEFKVRLQVTSIAIELACARAVEKKIWPSYEMCVASLVVLGNAESNFMGRVQAGQCKKYECDPNKFGAVRAASYWQIHKAPNQTEEEWKKYIGLHLTNVTAAAWRACTLLGGYLHSCGSLSGAFGKYASGSSCWNPWTTGRADKVYKTLGQYKENK